MLERERELVAATGRRRAAEGLVRGGSGDVSARAGEHVAIRRAGAKLASLRAEAIVIVHMDGAVESGERAAAASLAAL